MEPIQRQYSDDKTPPERQVSSRGLSITITPRTIWYAVGTVVALAIAWALISRALSALLIIFIAIIIGEATRPIVLELERRRVPRPLGVLMVLLVAAIVIGILLWILITPLVSEIGDLTANAPTYTKRLEAWIASVSATLHTNAQFGSFIDGLARQIFSSLQGLAPSLIQVPITLLSGAFGGLLSVVVTVTIVVFWLSSSAKLRDFLFSLFPERAQSHLDLIFEDIGRSLGGYIRGVLIAMLLDWDFHRLGSHCAGRALCALAWRARWADRVHPLSRPVAEWCGSGASGAGDGRSAEGARSRDSVHGRAATGGESHPAVRDEPLRPSRSAADPGRDSHWQ